MIRPEKLARVAILGLATQALGATYPPSDPRATVVMARDTMLSHVGTARRLLGEDTANDVILRLNDDVSALDEARPDGYPAADWDEKVSNVLRLDQELVGQATSAEVRPLGTIRGLAEALVKSEADGTYQPLALYVPSSYVPGKATPVVVVLHGRPQTETELLGVPYFRELAESSGAILVAPWGRGLYDFAEPAASEVYSALDKVEAAFSIDRHREYLAGYSMGGFSVFKVAPKHGERWRAILCIAGSMLGSQTLVVRWQLRETPFYIVNGAEDTSIPPKLGQETASYLASAGIPTSFYQEAHGTHSLRTIVPALTKAWNDMFSGAVRGDASPGSSLPGTPPAAAKPT